MEIDPGENSEIQLQAALLWQSWEQLVGPSVPHKQVELVRRAAAFVSSLGDFLGFSDVTPFSSNETAPTGFLCERHVKFSRDIPQAFGQTVRIYVAKKQQFTALEYGQLLNSLSSTGLGFRIYLVFVPGITAAIKKETRRNRSGIVIIDNSDVNEIALANDPAKVFYRIVRQQSNDDLIQPYNHFGATKKTMFFGRQKELARIKLNPNKSFAIFGGRRVGKTSLLTRIADDLSQDTSNKVVFFSAQGITDIGDFSSRLLNGLAGSRLNPNVMMRRFDLEQFRNDLKNEILLSSKRVHILVDEVDELVTIDRKRGEPMLTLLRSVNEELSDRCRFIFAGFRRLYDRVITYYSPGMNFLIPIHLSVLDERSARELVEVPLGRYLGLEIEPSVIDLILEYSSLVPWQIQHYCECLVKSVVNQQKDIVTAEDVKTVYKDFVFRNEVVETTLANLTDEQMAILCLFINSSSFSKDDVHNSFNREQIPMDLVDLSQQLNRMVIFGVLNSNPNGKFSFVYSHLPEIIKETESTGRLLNQAKMRIKRREKRVK